MTQDTANIVTVFASARRGGNTFRMLEAILGGRPAQQFDLSTLHIRDYEYDRPADGDDFLTVANAMAEADGVLFATPVYWYAMSATLKRFFDRLTDLVTVHKPLGRRMAGVSMWVAACGSDPTLPEGFEAPFRGTAAYFDMAYGGAFYMPVQNGKGLSADKLEQATAFGSKVFTPVASS